MDAGLNMSGGGNQFDLQFPIPDLSTYESPSGFTVSGGPTRNRRARLHLATPYSRNNNRPAQVDNTSINWLRALINKFISVPNFIRRLFESVEATPQRESQRGETSPRHERWNENEMDVDQQQPNGIVQGRLVQSNRIFEEPINNPNGLNSRSRHRPEMIPNNAIKRKRSEDKSVSIDAIEEELVKQEQIEDQNHKPDLKELYLKNISPDWYKPFKNNPDKYPKFASSLRVTSDIYGPDQNLNSPKESPPPKKFKPSIVPTPRWFDYYPLDKDENTIDRKRTENIVEKRKVEEKTIEKDKVLHRSKKGKEKAENVNLEIKPIEKISTATNRISPVKDQNYFSILPPPVLASTSSTTFPPIGNIGNQSQLSPVAEISITMEDKENNITTPVTTSQNVKSPSSMESVEFTHETENNDTPTPSVNNHFANSTAKDKIETRQSTPWFKTVPVDNESPLPLLSESNNDILVDKPAPLIVNDNHKEQVSTSLFIDSTKNVEKKVSLTEFPQKLAQSTPITNEQKDIDSGSINSLFNTNKDHLIPSKPFAPLVSNNLKEEAQQFVPTTTLSLENIKETGKSQADGGKDEEKITKAIEPQPQENPALKFQNSLGANTTAPSIFSTNLPIDNKNLPLSPAFASKPDSTATPTTVTANFFGSTAAPTPSTSQPFKFDTSGLFSNNLMFSNVSNDGDNNGKSDKSTKPYKSTTRFKKNKRSCGTSGSGSENTLSNQKTTSVDQNSNRLLVSTSGQFNFSKPEISTSLFNTQTPSQPSFNFNEIQTQQTLSSSSGPMFGSNVITSFGTSPSDFMFGASQTTFTFGNSSHVASTGFSTSSVHSGSIFGANQSSNASTGFTGFGAPSLSNFENQMTQNGHQNNLFQSQQNDLPTMPYQQESLSHPPSLNFNFGVNGNSGQGFSNNNPMVPNQNQGFNMSSESICISPNTINPSMFSFHSGSDAAPQGTAQRKIRRMRTKRAPRN
ncbi:18392_t:CDS:2 [Funneliformis geosporum]|uniref:13631_t:CDS:1 n=1 Tax=Funneliformis geosporum TaxID=1117311 RepID=A0A9W4SRH4_9GLOM|nr:18392_t:CDS:2 [Funneliformis geosporum]CAI2176481.1 13631_t:CDS:2 [Funneliformis geosporum]